METGQRQRQMFGLNLRWPVSLSHLFGQAQFDVQRLLRHQKLEGGFCHRDHIAVVGAELDLPDAETNGAPDRTSSLHHATNNKPTPTENKRCIFKEDNVSLFVQLLVLVLTAEGFHLKLHSTFLSDTQRNQVFHLITSPDSGPELHQRTWFRSRPAGSGL